MKNRYKNLNAWKKSMKLLEMVYDICNKLPDKERYVLEHQLKKCAVSVPSNIAEGYGRKTTKEMIHFLYIAKGSLYEMETQLIILKNIRLSDNENIDPSLSLLEECLKLVNGTIKHYKNIAPQNSKNILIKPIS